MTANECFRLAGQTSLVTIMVKDCRVSDVIASRGATFSFQGEMACNRKPLYQLIHRAEVFLALQLASWQRHRGERTASAPAAVKTGYAPVNGLKMYYEIHGSGEPLVLIHGGVVGITMFGPNVEALAKGRQVIAVELQGHGHTADIDRPMTVEALADDIAALIQVSRA